MLYWAKCFLNHLIQFLLPCSQSFANDINRFGQLNIVLELFRKRSKIRDDRLDHVGLKSLFGFNGFEQFLKRSIEGRRRKLSGQVDASSKLLSSKLLFRIAPFDHRMRGFKSIHLEHKSIEI